MCGKFIDICREWMYMEDACIWFLLILSAIFDEEITSPGDFPTYITLIFWKNRYNSKKNMYHSGICEFLSEVVTHVCRGRKFFLSKINRF